MRVEPDLECPSGALTNVVSSTADDESSQSSTSSKSSKSKSSANLGGVKNADHFVPRSSLSRISSRSSTKEIVSPSASAVPDASFERKPSLQLGGQKPNLQRLSSRVSTSSRASTAEKSRGPKCSLKGWLTGLNHEKAMCFLILADFVLLLSRYHMIINKNERSQLGWSQVQPERMSFAWNCTNVFFLIVFGLEVALQIVVRGGFAKLWKERRYKELLDLPLLLLSMVGAFFFGVQSRAAILPRAFRMVRIAFLGEFQGQFVGLFRPLFVLCQTMMYSLSVVAAGFCVFIVNLLFFSMLAMEFLLPAIEEQIRREVLHRGTGVWGAERLNSCNHAFSSLHQAMSTLFALSIGDRWTDVAYPVLSLVPWSFWLFLGYTLVAWVMISGAAYAGLSEVHHAYSKLIFDVALDAEERTQHFQRRRLNAVFDLMARGRNHITFQQFFHRWNSNDLQPFFRSIGIPAVHADAELAWDMIDTDGDGTVQREEWLSFMNRMRPGTSKWQLVRTVRGVEQTCIRLHGLSTSRQKEMSGMHDKLDKLNRSNTVDAAAAVVAAAAAAAAESPKVPQNKHSPDRSSLDKTPSLRRSFTVQSVSDADQRSSHQTSIQQTNSKDVWPSESKNVALCLEDAQPSHNMHTVSSPLSSLLPDSQGVVEIKAQLGVAQTANIDDLMEAHMRGVLADQVAQFSNPEVVDFWGTGTFSESSFDDNFSMSSKVQQCDYFVSHCWNDPPDWFKYFQRTKLFDTYAYRKAVELNNVLNSQTADSGKALSDMVVWIDKCCIPQNDKKAKAICVSLIEQFLSRCNGMVVLLSWHYFTRLWCVYEWACFLTMHDPSKIEIGCDAFLKTHPEETLPLFLQSIEALSVKNTQCNNLDDHAILEKKVYEYYRGKRPEDSFRSFENFAKCTAICFFARQIAIWRAYQSSEDEAAWFQPVRDAAKRLGIAGLSKIFDSIQPNATFVKCGKQPHAYLITVNAWFEEVVCAYLIAQRQKSVRRRHLTDQAKRFETNNTEGDYLT